MYISSYILKPNKTSHSVDLNKLVSDLSAGSVEAYSAIYRLYYSRLYRYAMQIHPHQQFVEDVLQDFFTYLAENCRKIRKVSNFEIYLFQSVKRNLFARLSRQQRSRLSRDRYHLLTDPLQEQAAPAADQQLLDRESTEGRRRSLENAMATLPGHQREILYLRYYEEMSYQEICAILDLNHQVARNYLSRALKQLKKALWNTELLFSLFVLFC